MAAATRRVAAFGPIGATGKSIGALGIILVIQLSVFAAAIDNSPILPGNWAPLVPVMEFYFVLFFAAILLLGFKRDLLLSAPGETISSFILKLSGTSAATWLVMSLAFLAGGALAPLNDTIRLQDFFIYGVMVAPIEEVFFRRVLPTVLNSWILGSVVLFAAFHVPVYYLEVGGTFGVPLISALILAGIMGFVLWIVYAKREDGGLLGLGLGGSIGVHLTYDLVTIGCVGAIPLALAHLGLVPV